MTALGVVAAPEHGITAVWVVAPAHPKSVRGRGR
jgi:hypothetical protein